MYYSYEYLIYILPGLILAMYAQAKIQREYNRYSQIDSRLNYTGFDAAKKILEDNGINDVRIRTIPGTLTDHYDPRDKTLNLSESVYYGRSIASIGVAAHEVGHAIQHNIGYVPLKFRSALVPIANIGSNLSMLFIILGLIFSDFLVKLGVIFFAAAVLFQIVTLPVEFNASARAQDALSNQILADDELEGSKEVLKAAALTYVAATITAIGQLLRLMSITNNRRE